MKDEKYYCPADYQKVSVLKCKVCQEVLQGEVVSALSHSFHKGCFVCSMCKYALFILFSRRFLLFDSVNWTILYTFIILDLSIFFAEIYLDFNLVWFPRLPTLIIHHFLDRRVT